MTSLRSTSKTFALLASLACFTLLLSVFGCNTERLTAPAPAPERVVTNPIFISILSTPDKDDFHPALTSGSKTISAKNGGSVENDFIRLDFPPGALNKDTQITIEMLSPDKLTFELSPHGIKFDKPVILTVDLSKTASAGMADETETLWFNAKKGWWEPVQKLGSRSFDEARSALGHFSKYGTQLGG